MEFREARIEDRENVLKIEENAFTVSKDSFNLKIFKKKTFRFLELTSCEKHKKKTLTVMITWILFLNPGLKIRTK